MVVEKWINIIGSREKEKNGEVEKWGAEKLEKRQ